MRAILMLVACAVACGDDAEQPRPDTVAADTSEGADTSPADTVTDSMVAPDTSALPDVAEVSDAIEPASVPLIGEVLTCGKRAEAGGVPRGPELERHTVDVARFPDALCNDGSTAVFYFRPYAGEANRDRWVIQLKGGGGCGGPVSCAQRWCSVLTNFGKSQMVDDINTPPLATVGAQGVLARRGDNPFGDYNHVYIQYCSADGWSGSVRDRVVDTFMPCEPGATCRDGSTCPGEDAGDMAGLCAGEPVRFRMHLLGSRIVDAVIDTLRRDGVGGPATGGVPLPDLDDAEHVVLAGASAGGAGVTANLDRVASRLRERNSRCQGADCGLVVDGIIDSIFDPSVEGLDLTQSPRCPDPASCTYELWMQAQYANASTFTGALADESCPQWHAEHAPGTQWRCADRAHVISHHIATPFMLRMGLVDSLLVDGFLAARLRTADGELIDQPIEYAALVHEQLEWFTRWSELAEEAGPGTIPPAVFGPGCAKHETLSDDVSVFDATIDFQGTPRDMFEVWAFWKGGGSPAVLVADTPADSECE